LIQTPDILDGDCLSDFATVVGKIISVGVSYDANIQAEAIQQCGNRTLLIIVGNIPVVVKHFVCLTFLAKFCGKAIQGNSFIFDETKMVKLQRLRNFYVQVKRYRKMLKCRRPLGLPSGIKFVYV